MKLIQGTIILVAGLGLAACEDGSLREVGPDKTLDRGFDSKDLSQLQAGIWVDPNGGEPAVVATGTGDDGVAIEALRIELPALLPPPDAPAYFARLLISVVE